MAPVHRKIVFNRIADRLLPTPWRFLPCQRNNIFLAGTSLVPWLDITFEYSIGGLTTERRADTLIVLLFDYGAARVQRDWEGDNGD